MSDTPETDNNAYECIQRFEMGGSTTAEKQSCQQGDCVSADFARKLERERDEARNDRNAALSDRDAWARLCGAADCYTPSTSEPYEALKLQRDELRAEVERLKSEAELYSGWSKWRDGIWRISHPDSGPWAEWIAEDIEELKADKARLDWIKALDCDSPVWGVLCDTTKLRETIDAAMKGEL